MRKNKKILAGVLAVLLAFVAVGGTIAWLTATSHLSNSFSIGNFNQPTTEPGDPDTPIDPENPDNPQNDNLDGNLYEPNFDPDEAILSPGDSIVKDPYVGIGKGSSDDAYVFVYVKNNTLAEGKAEKDLAPYFTLNNGWLPVTDNYNGSDIGNYELQGTGKQAYTGGLFVYTWTDASNPALLEASETQDVWTTNPLFSSVVVPETADKNDFDADNATIEVYSFLIASDNVQDALDSAIAWANHPNGPVTDGE